VRDNRVNYVVVGLFVLASLAGLVVAVAMLTGRTGATDDYYAVYGNVTGVKFGTQVFYEGYPIGQVETVTPQQNAGRMEFRVDFSVIEDWRIPDDSVVHIAAPSLLSAKALDIRAGDSPDPLEPGARVTSVEAADVFAVVNDVAAEFQSLSRDSVRPLLANLNDAVLNIDSMVSGDGATMLAQIKTLVDQVSQRAPQMLADIETFSTNLALTSTDIAAVFTPDMTAKIRDAVDGLTNAANGIDALMADAEALVKAANATVAETGEMVSDNRGKIDDTLTDVRLIANSVARNIDSINHHLDGASRNMYEFTRQIRANPGLLLSGTSPPDEAAE
jgi:phospholipid/cholesterol/gamma-HCH transport system substrate-binding protein